MLTSPFVIYTSLAAAAIGAADNTRKELEQLLCVTDIANLAHIESKFILLQRSIFRQNSSFMFMGRFMYYDDTLAILPQFNKTMKQVFELKPKKLNFLGTKTRSPNPATTIEDLIEHINCDMKVATEGVVDDVVDDQEVTKATKLLLVSAIMFRGYWASGFTRVDEPASRQFRFRITDDSPIQTEQVPMMRQHGKFKYMQDAASKMSAVQLDYESSDLAMLVLLPDEPTTFGSELYAHIDLDTYDRIIRGLKEEYVCVTMPVFALHDKKVSIKGTLEKLGCKTLFTRERPDREGADFTNFSEPPPDCLFRIAHKAFILVDEKVLRAVLFSPR